MNENGVWAMGKEFLSSQTGNDSLQMQLAHFLMSIKNLKIMEQRPQGQD